MRIIASIFIFLAVLTGILIGLHYLTLYPFKGIMYLSAAAIIFLAVMATISIMNLFEKEKE